MMRSVAVLALFLFSAQAYQQAFVVREQKGPDSPFLSRELGGKNHVAPHNAVVNEGADPGVVAVAEAPMPPPPEAPIVPAEAPMPPQVFSAMKPGQIIVPREGEDGKENFIKPGIIFATQSIFMPPPQRAAWSVTPEQHGAAR